MARQLIGIIAAIRRFFQEGSCLRDKSSGTPEAQDQRT
jgi:hypothetical protein